MHNGNANVIVIASPFTYDQGSIILISITTTLSSNATPAA